MGRYMDPPEKITTTIPKSVKEWFEEKYGKNTKSKYSFAIITFYRLFKNLNPEEIRKFTELWENQDKNIEKLSNAISTLSKSADFLNSRLQHIPEQITKVFMWINEEQKKIFDKIKSRMTIIEDCS